MTSPTISGSGHVVSFNQSGGVTAGTYINHAPQPKLDIVGESGWNVSGSRLKKDFKVQLTNPGAATLLKITAYGEGVLGVGFSGAGMMSTGKSDSGPGWASAVLLTPGSIRVVSVYASKTTELTFDTTFN